MIRGRESEVNSISRSPAASLSTSLFPARFSVLTHSLTHCPFLPSFALSERTRSVLPPRRNGGGGAFRCVSPYQICWRCITDDDGGDGDVGPNERTDLSLLVFLPLARALSTFSPDDATARRAEIRNLFPPPPPPLPPRFSRPPAPLASSTPSSSALLSRNISIRRPERRGASKPHVPG